MLRLMLALSLTLGFFTFAATPQAEAGQCFSNSSCGGKYIGAKKTCSSCLRSGGGKSWLTDDNKCVKKC